MRSMGWFGAIMFCIAAAYIVMLHQPGLGDFSPLVGKAAPPITLGSLGGTQVNLADEKGKVVVADFWATWCPPCRASLPHIQTLSSNADWIKDGLVVWAVNAQEDPDTVARFLRDNNYTFTVLLDATGSTMAAYAGGGIPTTVIIGRDGLIKNLFVGTNGQETAHAIDDAVQKALAQSVN